MLKNIAKYTTIKGVSIYECNEQWKEQGLPCAIDIEITVSEQTHPTTDIPFMGTMSVPDQSRVDNITITANVNVDDPNAQRLCGKGMKYWKACWVDEVVEANGLISVVGYNIYSKGFVGGQPEAAKNTGGDNSGGIVMNCVGIKKQDSNGVVAYDIDRSQNRLIRNGEDYRSEINRLL